MTTTWVHLAAVMSEAELQADIITYCEGRGLIVIRYPRPELLPVKGWPDLEIIGPDGTLYRELKTMTGALTVEQRAVGSRLQRWGRNWAVWRPIDWWTGVIERQLCTIKP